MQVNPEAKRILLSPEEVDLYTSLSEDEREGFEVWVTRRLHREHPGLSSKAPFEVVDSSGARLFYVFTY